MFVRRWYLLVVVVFVAGFAGGICLDRYGLRVPASIPAAKPSIREQIVGQWEGVIENRKVVFEFDSKGTLTEIGTGKVEGPVAIQWLDDDHIEFPDAKEPIQVNLKDDRLVFRFESGKVYRFKRKTTN